MAIPNWITLSRSTGSGNGTVIVTISPNTGAARACTLTVGTGKISKTLSISQEAYVPPVARNKIFYTSTDGNVVVPKNTTGWTANIVSNTYVDGRGVIEFDGEITEVPVGAFRFCLTLTSINLPNGITSIKADAFRSCSSLTVLELPSTVTYIGTYAFSECKFIEFVVPPLVSQISSWTFVNCKKLEKIVLPSGMGIIYDHAFSGCQSLKEVVFPSALTSIEKNAFSHCESLTEITIPSGVTNIGQDAFDSCTNLTEINILNPVPTAISSDAIGIFDGSTCPIYVPCGTENAYKIARGWKRYASRIVGDCPPEPTGDTHYLASNLSYDITVRITDDDEKTIVPATTLTHNDSISWEGNDSIVIRMTSPTADTVRVRNDNGDYLTDNITLTPNVETSSPKIVMTGVERLRIVSMLMKSVKPVVEEDEE